MDDKKLLSVFFMPLTSLFYALTGYLALMFLFVMAVCLGSIEGIFGSKWATHFSDTIPRFIDLLPSGTVHVVEGLSDHYMEGA